MTHLINKSVKASIHVLKLRHDRFESHTTRGRRRSEGGRSGMGQRSRRLDPWPLQSKLGLAPSNRHRTYGTHNDEVRRLEIKDRGVANDPCDSRWKDKLIMGHRILIDIYKGEYEVREKVDEGQQKASMRLSNRITVKQGM